MKLVPVFDEFGLVEKIANNLTIAVILIIGWAIGTFAYTAGSLIHILLVIAIISFILGFLRRDTTVG
jgi:hypothetical protein